MARTIVWAAVLLLVPLALVAAGIEPVAPLEKDKCPVCGMFVAKYKDWVAEVIFEDGGYAVFDGPKDMFTYLLNLEKYAPGRTQGGVAAVYVTEYYSLEFIDARGALFVMGSDVYGPMGKELIPFRQRKDAEEFMKDHRGQRIVTFDEVTADVLGALH